MKAIQEKISTITTSRTPVVCTYRVDDESVNAELRLRAQWTIEDYIACKDAYLD